MNNLKIKNASKKLHRVHKNPLIGSVVINDVSPDEIANGVYVDEFNQYRWTYRVNVTVQDGKIVNLQFDNGGTLEQKLAEWIIKKQSLDVDINSGATVNSKAFLKAVESALIRKLKACCN